MVYIAIQIDNIPGIPQEALFLDIPSQRIVLSKLLILSILKTVEKMRLKVKTGG
jgi:hypothetical protein